MLELTWRRGSCIVNRCLITCRSCWTFVPVSILKSIIYVNIWINIFIKWSAWKRTNDFQSTCSYMSLRLKLGMNSVMNTSIVMELLWFQLILSGWWRVIRTSCLKESIPFHMSLEKIFKKLDATSLYPSKDTPFVLHIFIQIKFDFSNSTLL